MAHCEAAVDEDMNHTSGWLRRREQGSGVAIRLRIEHRDVGVLAHCETTAIGQPEAVGGLRGEFANRQLRS